MEWKFTSELFEKMYRQLCLFARVKWPSVSEKENKSCRCGLTRSLMALGVSGIVPELPKLNAPTGKSIRI